VARYVVRRVLQSVILLVIVSIVGFAILNLAPGGPLAAYALQPGMTAADRERIADQLGLNKPLPVQYLRWAQGLTTGDWGRSYRNEEPVTSIVLGRLPATLELMITAEILSIFLGLLIGILGAVKRYSLPDNLATIGAMIGLSIPTFWFGLMMIYVFSVELGWLPPGNISTVGNGSLLDRIHHLIAPVLVLALVTVAIWSRYTRSSMIDVINQDYVRTARSKGIRERAVMVRHALRNAILPLITIAGLQLPALFGGALVTETVFTWPGMGRLFVDSLGYRDYPVLMGILMFTAVIVLIGNLVADVLYAVADPRIRLE
jgi:peptide/nickel transport system permease protein